MITACQVEGMLSDAETTLLERLGGMARLCIVEIGSYRGRSTIALATHAQVPVYAIDPHEPFTAEGGHIFEGGADRAAFMRNVLDAGMAEKIRLVNLSSAQAESGWIDEMDLLWIDGDHRAEAVRIDAAIWKKYLVLGGIIALHDCYEPGVQAAMLDLELTGEFERLETVGLIAQYRRIDHA